MNKLIAIALGLSFTINANAGFVSHEHNSCGVNKICLDEVYRTCKFEKPKQIVAKKRKPTKKKKVISKVEKQCEQIVNNHYHNYFIEQKSNVPFSLIRDTPTTSVWAQPSHYQSDYRFNNGLGGIGMTGGYYIIQSAQEGTVTSVIAPPATPNNNLNTPLPSAFWLMASIVGFIFRLKRSGNYV